VSSNLTVGSAGQDLSAIVQPSGSTIEGAAQSRRRGAAAIAATANVHGVPLLTYNAKDFQIIADKVDIRQA
jgi:predicted nucleic acid-binding protein